MAKIATPRWGWALTGSGHFFRECLVAIRALENIDLFVSKAASEVLRMYKQDLALPTSARIFRDTTASSPPVGYFYYGVYHTLVLAPATSNTVAKCVYGISDNLATNVFAQAGKCRVPTIIWLAIRHRNSKPKHRKEWSRSIRVASISRIPTDNPGGRVARRTRTSIGAP